MVNDSDFQKWQKAIQGIEAGQNNLSQDELSAFNSLRELYSNGDFQSNESDGHIKILKNVQPRHSSQRLLHVHLKNFVALCEQHFQTKKQSIAAVSDIYERQSARTSANMPPPAPKIDKPYQSSETAENTDNTKRSNIKYLIFTGVALVIGFLGYWVYDNWVATKTNIGESEYNSIAVK